jgi:hemoglobin-like flavoprotein
MGPGDLSALRSFFTRNERRLPDIVTVMYSRIFEAVPEAKPLFKGDLQEQQAHYMRMLQSIVKLTRSSHLWPVSAFSGKASLPVLDKLGTIHADVGITHAHFDLMKAVLSQCCREVDPAGFTAGVESALGFIFDVVANSLVKTCDIHEEELANKNKLPLRGDEMPVEDFDRFFNSEALATELLQAQTFH